VAALFLWKLPAEGVPLEAISARAGCVKTRGLSPAVVVWSIWKLPAERFPLVAIKSVAGCLLVGGGHGQRWC